MTKDIDKMVKDSIKKLQNNMRYGYFNDIYNGKMSNQFKSKLIDSIEKEIMNQYNKFGNQITKGVLEWNAIIIEEFLEIEKEINSINPIGLKEEIIQTIACLIQLLNKIKL